MLTSIFIELLWIFNTLLHFLRVNWYEIINSDGKRVDTVDVALLHVAEDYRMKGVPSIQDIVQHIDIQPWMVNGAKPIPSGTSKKEVEELLKRI
mgnify:CR=1 FL=1